MKTVTMRFHLDLSTLVRILTLTVLTALAIGAAGLAQAACQDCGSVTDIRTVTHEGQASGLGAIAGGVAGAVVGNQFGKGSGNTAMTIVGAGGGAFAGHQVEKSMKKKTEWQVFVKFDNGEQRTFNYAAQPEVRKGDRIKLRDGKLLLLAN